MPGLAKKNSHYFSLRIPVPGQDISRQSQTLMDEGKTKLDAKRASVNDNYFAAAATGAPQTQMNTKSSFTFDKDSSS